MRTFWMYAVLGAMFCGGTLGTQARAQAPVWTRQLSPARWKEVTRGGISRVNNTKLFIDLSRQLPAVQQVKTTDHNWIRHKIFYSALFSKQEKDILLTPAYAQAMLGKIVYLYNKHAAFYDRLSSPAYIRHIRPQAFEKHQQTLKTLTGTLQRYYAQTYPEQFANTVFSTEEIQRLHTLPAQPAAYLISPQELAEFANLPSNQAQQAWTQRHIRQATWETQVLLAKPIETLSPAEFENYYYYFSQLSYFKLLARVLEHTSTKRASAILRYKLPLREGEEPLTDAQRGGKLLFEKNRKHSPQAQADFEQFQHNYSPYAAAEALEAPYEIALQFGSYAPELLGVREAARLRQLEPQACLDEVLPKIADLDKQLTQQSQKIPADNAFYVAYYKLYAQLQIYQTLAAKARFMINFNR